jgi:hypothetical protein
VKHRGKLPFDPKVFLSKVNGGRTISDLAVLLVGNLATRNGWHKPDLAIPMNDIREQR